jgi:two-component system, OmpR family, phosphate regulon sensor histidine kinase PhoR
MRPGPLFGALIVIAAVPSLALALLAATGAAEPRAVAYAWVGVLIGALVLAALWTHDMERLAETLRHAALENRAALGASAGSAVLPPVERIGRAIERLSRTLAARAAQVEHLLRATEAIVDRLPDPLLVLGDDRGVRRTNAAARAAFGSEIAAVLRHPVLREAIDRAFSGGQPQAAELSLPVPVPRDLRATVLVFDPPLADGGRAIVVLSDRTRERAVERMRADFVANVSHELRTPLASLIGFIDTLRGPAADDPPAQQRFLGIMGEQAQRMNRLIDDLLSLSRIELIEHQAPSERVDVAEVARRITAAFEPRVADRGVRLQLDVAPDLPEVTGDPDQIEQVLQNLVDNAVKYGREGGMVRIAVKQPQPGRWPARPGVVLSVYDDGPGIPREHLPRLTERFYRVDKGRSRGAGGTGLGLAIVKHIVNRHRGQLAIDSDTGQGATFAVWLPAAVVERETVREAAR